MRLNLPNEPVALDPRLGDVRSQIVIRMLFEGLTRIGPDNEPLPAMAESWEISPDHRTYTFRLREAFWSSGEPVTAKDFEYAWKSVVNPDFGSPFGFVFEMVKNYDAVRQREKDLEELGVFAVDDKTLVVELAYQAPYFISLLANAVCSPVFHRADFQAPNWSQDADGFVSNGPFCLHAWDHGEGLRLKPNPHYWDRPVVRLEGIDISIVDDGATVLMMFENGELDWAGQPLSDLPQDAIPKIRHRNEFQTHHAGALFHLQLDVAQLPFRSQLMRQAFSNAIDRQAIVSRLLQGGESAAQSIVLPSHSLMTQPRLSDRDVTLAREQFSKGLKELGVTAEELPPIVFTYGNLEGVQALAQAVQQQWEETLGVRVVLEGLDWHSFIDRLKGPGFQVGATFWSSWLEDPIYNLGLVRYADRGVNRTHWDCREYTLLLEQADHAVTVEERQELLRQAEELVMEALPVVPVFFSTFKYLKNPELRGVCISDIGQIDFKQAYFVSEDDVS